MANSKIKKVYIHIGLHKTGTSSIQATLAKNKKILQDNSICYITEFGINHSEFLVPIFLDNPNVYHIVHKKNLPSDVLLKEYAEIKSLLHEKINNINETTVVFSGEDLSTYSHLIMNKLDRFLRKVAPQAVIKVVACLREPSDFFASSFQQIIRSGYVSQFYNVKEVKFSYKNTIEYLINIFGSENIIVYDFEKAVQHRLGVAGYFIENVLEMKSNNYTSIKALHINESIPDTAVHMIYYLNCVTDSPIKAFNAKLSFERYMNDTMPLWSVPGKKFKLNEEQVRDIYHMLCRDLVWLKSNHAILYDISKASYAQEIYEIPSKYFYFIKKAFPKLSRLLRRALYEYICTALEERSNLIEKEQLSLSKKWIEKKYQDTIAFKLDEWKIMITNEINACSDFYKDLGITGKNNHQLYYNLYIIFLDLNDLGSAQLMDRNYREKNPDYIGKWESPAWRVQFDLIRFKMKKKAANFKQIKLDGREHFRQMYNLNDAAIQNLVEQAYCFLDKHKYNFPKS